MFKGRLLLLVLIGIALVLVPLVVWQFATAGGGNVEAETETDPIAVRIEGHRRNGDTAALVREASSADVKVVRLAMYALADSGPVGVPHIERAIRDDRPQVREAAAAALGRAAGRDRSGLLAEVVSKDTAANVRATAASALGQMRAYNEMETLITALEDSDRMVRSRANAAINRITGVHFKFRADDPLKERNKAIAMIRRLWPTMKPNIERYYAKQDAKDRES